MATEKVDECTTYVKRDYYIMNFLAKKKCNE